jgi:hypothetical protein
MESNLPQQSDTFTGTVRTGQKTFTFTIPPGQYYERCQFSVVSTPLGGGANLIAQPARGAQGQIKIDVIWWLAPVKPFPPLPPLPVPTTQLKLVMDVIVNDRPPGPARAILVCIENTGEIGGNVVPFPYQLDPGQAMVVKRVVDTVTEVSEYLHSSRLFREKYDVVEILADTDCTKANIQASIARLGAQCQLDLAILGHGGSDAAGSARLVLHPPELLLESDVLAWRTLPAMRNLNLGLVYMMNCQGSKFSDAWTAFGFKTSVGSDGDDWIPEPLYTRFWQHYMAGDTAAQAASRAWEDAKALWQVVPGYLPDIQVDPGVPPRVVVDDPGSPGRGHLSGVPPKWVWVDPPRPPRTHLEPGRPPSTTTTLNPRIAESKLVVGGDGNRRF